MVDEETNDTIPPLKVSKKPVPLPRKSLGKTNSVSMENDNGNDNDNRKKSDNRYFIRGDWKTASEIIHEKSKLVKNEVQKSVRNIISKRRSAYPKPSPKVDASEYFRSSSLPDDNLFCSISFNSPLADENVESHASNSDVSSDDGSFYTTSELPPPYPPPELPDESTYDEVTSVTSSDGQSYYLPSSDSNSLYEDLVKYQTANKPLSKYCDLDNSDVMQDKIMKSDSWAFYDAAERIENRYEVIEEQMKENHDDLSEVDYFDTSTNPYANTILIPNTYKPVSENVPEVEEVKKPRQTSSLISQFDPLLENKMPEKEYDLLSEISETFKSLLGSSCSRDVTDSASITSSSIEESLLGITNPFQNPIILNSLSEEDSGDEVDVKNSEDPSVPVISSEEHIYGKVNKLKNHDVRESVSEELKNYDVELPPPSAAPPIPPRRFDSITNEEPVNEKTSTEKPEEAPEKPKTSINRWWSVKRKARIMVENIESRAPWTQGKKPEKKSENDNRNSPDKTADDANGSTFYVNSVKEEIYSPVSLNHNGVLYKPGGVQRWGVLSQRKLTLFANKDSPDVKETIPVDTILSLRAVTDNKMNVEGEHIYSFEISLQSKSQPYLFGAPSASERHLWMRLLLENITPAFPPKLSLDYDKAGWCYAKEGISSEWTKSSLLLHSRTLYLSSKNGVLLTADLRKARYLTLQNNDLACKQAFEKGPLLLIDLQEKTLYLQMDVVRETKAWESIIVSAALENGPSLSEQQLTKDGVPTIVDKCINFIHTHGSMSEGIYRRNGSNSVVTKLLGSFRRNAWSIQLTRQNFNEYDVSSVLKRFFRHLPEPLFVSELHNELRQITETPATVEEKLKKYSETLKKLPEINYATAKRLMGHLYFIDKQKDKNLMPIDNLAAIWGPTLMQIQEGTSLDPNWSRVESSVINDLITYYPQLFEIDETELEKEMKILEVLENYHSTTTQVSKKPSGDLKIWIHLNSKDKEECINISINPQKTSEEICEELSYKMNQPGHLLCLEEVICNNSMYRPLHHSELILDTVLRWSYWDEQDRKDNCLVLRKNDVFQTVLPYTKPPLVVCEEFKFADQKSKSFKTYQFQFSHAKLCYYKDKSCSVKIGEWKIEDLIWYIGHEPKRNPHTGWSITFIEKTYKGPRSKERPFFGNTICGTTEEQKLKLMAAMLTGQYNQEILPSVNLI